MVDFFWLTRTTFGFVLCLRPQYSNRPDAQVSRPKVIFFIVWAQAERPIYLTCSIRPSYVAGDIINSNGPAASVVWCGGDRRVPSDRESASAALAITWSPCKPESPAGPRPSPPAAAAARTDAALPRMNFVVIFNSRRS